MTKLRRLLPGFRGSVWMAARVSPRSPRASLKQAGSNYMYTPRAFTLIEVLITTALFAVLIGAITQLYVVFGRMVSLKQSTIGATLSVSAITDAVRGAGLEAGGVASTHVFSSTSYSSGTTTVIFELPAVDASGAPVINAYDYVGVHATGTSVYRFIDAAPGSFRTSGTKQLTSVLDEL